MSNIQPLITIETSNLSRVSGGGTTAIHAQARAPGGASGGIDFTSGNRDYEACQAAAHQTAVDAYPDTRNLLGVISGAPDLNARRRADYERQGDDRCLAIANGTRVAPAPAHRGT